MKFNIVGKINNWMDLRDRFIEFLNRCDTEMKFNRFISGIIISIGGLETIKKTRKELGLPPLSKEEERGLKAELNKTRNKENEGEIE